MIILLPLLFLLSYFLVRKVWFQLKRVRTVATIEKISLGILEPNLVLPEVKVFYKYYFQSGLYYGAGYMNVADFLPEETFHFHISRENLPILYYGEEEITSEEHIEHFLLSRAGSVLIHIDPIEPYHSQIDSLNSKHLEMV